MAIQKEIEEEAEADVEKDPIDPHVYFGGERWDASYLKQRHYLQQLDKEQRKEKEDAVAASGQSAHASMTKISISIVDLLCQTFFNEIRKFHNAPKFETINYYHN